MTLLLCPSCEAWVGDAPAREVDAELSHRIGTECAFDDMPCFECWNVDE